MQMKASFEQRLAVLAPKISELDRKQFVASWASMQNQNDYGLIVQKMEANAMASGIILPPLLSGAYPLE
jgi:hypothetical protein